MLQRHQRFYFGHTAQRIQEHSRPWTGSEVWSCGQHPWLPSVAHKTHWIHLPALTQKHLLWGFVRCPAAVWCLSTAAWPVMCRPASRSSERKKCGVHKTRRELEHMVTPTCLAVPLMTPVPLSISWIFNWLRQLKYKETRGYSLPAHLALL